MTKQHMILKNETSKFPARTHRHYAQHLADSFALVQRLVSVAQGQDACYLDTLRADSRTVPLELRVPFAQLAQVKAVNKRVGGGDADRWNPTSKRWVPPLVPSTPFAAWHSERAGAETRGAAVHALLEVQIAQTPPPGSHGGRAG